MQLNIKNEYDTLKSVVVSSAEYFNSDNLVLNNETIKYYMENGGIPSRENLLIEQKKFWEILRNKGINVLVAEQVDDARGQMFTRDLAFVIGNKLFISNMRKENRKAAINGWSKIIDDVNYDNIIKVPSDIYLEGGDVLVDGNKVFVGISERTTMEGVQFLKNVLSEEYEVIPLILKPGFLHLDVVFTIINSSLSLVYKEGFDEESFDKLCDYKKILITEEEQFKLGTNVFVIDKNNIIVNVNHKRIIEEIKNNGLNVIPLDFSETSKVGGAFRCVTCPLERID